MYSSHSGPRTKTYFNPCRVDTWYLGTDAAGHIPVDSICDVLLKSFTMHRVLHISIL